MVHQYQLNGYNIVLDTCSGSVHVVDDVAYDVIAMYPEHTADEIVSAMMAKYGDREDVTEEDLRQCIEDVTALKEAGKLWSPDVCTLYDCDDTSRTSSFLLVYQDCI